MLTDIRWKTPPTFVIYGLRRSEVRGFESCAVTGLLVGSLLPQMKWLMWPLSLRFVGLGKSWISFQREVSLQTRHTLRICTNNIHGLILWIWTMSSQVAPMDWVYLLCRQSTPTGFFLLLCHAYIHPHCAYKTPQIHIKPHPAAFTLSNNIRRSPKGSLTLLFWWLSRVNIMDFVTTHWVLLRWKTQLFHSVFHLLENGLCSFLHFVTIVKYAVQYVNLDNCGHCVVKKKKRKMNEKQMLWGIPSNEEVKPRSNQIYRPSWLNWSINHWQNLYSIIIILSSFQPAETNVSELKHIEI